MRKLAYTGVLVCVALSIGAIVGWTYGYREARTQAGNAMANQQLHQLAALLSVSDRVTQGGGDGGLMSGAVRSAIGITVSALIATRFDIQHLDGAPFSALCRLVRERRTIFVESQNPTPDTVAIAYLSRMEGSVKSEASRRKEILGAVECAI